MVTLPRTSSPRSRRQSISMWSQTRHEHIGLNIAHKTSHHKLLPPNLLQVWDVNISATSRDRNTILVIRRFYLCQVSSSTVYLTKRAGRTTTSLVWQVGKQGGHRHIGTNNVVSDRCSLSKRHAPHFHTAICRKIRPWNQQYTECKSCTRVISSLLAWGLWYRV